MSQQRTIASVALLAGLAALSLISLSMGDFPLPADTILSALRGELQGIERFILLDQRLPRVLTAAFAGAALGVSGALFQSITRNPLASPDIIGFNAGAALGAVLTLSVLGAAGGWMLAIGAMSGGLAAALLVFAATFRGGLQPQSIILAGIGVGFTAYAGVEFLLTRSGLAEASGIMHWLTGSLSARNWQHFQVIAIGCLVLSTPVIWLESRLLTLELGDEPAILLGLNVPGLRIGAALCGIGLIGAAISVAGPMAFVAFVAGPIARRLTLAAGPNLIQAALVGAIVLLAADLAGRMLFAPMHLPAGIFTAVFGAPYLIWLLWRQVRTGEL